MRFPIAGFLILWLVCAFGELASAFAQAPAAPLRFEVATVKPGVPPSPQNFAMVGVHGGPGTADPGQISYGWFTMKTLLIRAYGVEYIRISGPSWLDSENYDIVAKVPAGTTPEQANVMLQNLLVERFGLAVHHETKEMQIYELTIGKGGSKLKESVENPNAPPKPDDPSAPITRDKNGVPQYPESRPGWVLVGGPDRRVFLTVGQQPLSAVIPTLESRWGHVIVDKTGLTGKYDFSMEYASPTVAAAGAPANPIDTTINSAINTASDPAPSLAAIVQRDLGLKLEEKKAPVDILVIDHINRVPTDN